MRASQKVSYGDLGRTSKWTGPISHGTSRSHEILGVMLDDLSIVQTKCEERKEEKGDAKETSSFGRTTIDG